MLNILYSWTVFSLVTAQFICHLSSPESLGRLQEFSPDWRALKDRFLSLGWTSRVGFIPATTALVLLTSRGDNPGCCGTCPFGRGVNSYPNPLLLHISHCSHSNLFLTTWRWFRNFSLPSDLDLVVGDMSWSCSKHLWHPCPGFWWIQSHLRPPVLFIMFLPTKQ